MTNWIKTNKLGASLLLAVVLFFGFTMACQGVSLDKFIKVDVPREVQQATETPPTTTLRQAPYVFDEWRDYVERGTEQFTENIEDAWALYDVVATTVNTGLLSLEAWGQTIPGGTILIAAGTLLAGLFIKKPGTDRQIMAEKMASFNRGLATGRADAKADPDAG
jgi:hypothetical protein